MKKHIIAAVATMAVFGAFSTTANAAWTADTTGSTVAFQLTAKTAAALTGATVVYTEGTIPTGGKFTFRLTNGATFVANPTITTAAGTASILGSAVGATSATFSVTAGAILGAITLTPGSINLSAVPAGGIVDITYESFDNLGGAVVAATSLDAAGANAAASAPIFTMVDAGTATVTAQTDQAKVATGYKNHTVASGVENGTATTLTVVTPGDTTLAVANDGALITLTGNFAGIGSVSSLNVTSATAAGSLAGTTAGFFTIDTAAGKAYAAVTAAAVAGTVSPVFVWDGATAQVARSFTATVDGLAGTTPVLTYPYNIMPATTIYTTTRNGTSFKMNTVSVSDLIRLTNNDAAAAAMAITAGDAATGANVTAAAGAPALAATIPAGGTIVVTGADLLANFGNGAVFSFNIEATDVIAQQVHIVPGTGASTSVIRTGAGKTL